MPEASFPQSFVCVLIGTEIPVRPKTDAETSEFTLEVNRRESLPVNDAAKA